MISDIFMSKFCVRAIVMITHILSLTHELFIISISNPKTFTRNFRDFLEKLALENLEYMAINVSSVLHT